MSKTTATSESSLERVAVIAMRLAVGADVTIGSNEGEPFRFVAPPQSATLSISVKGSLSQEVTEFIAAHKMKPELARAIGMIYDHFPPGSTPSLRIETDPEAEGKWLAIDVKTWGGADAALKAYSGFVKDWVVAIPPAVRDAVRVTFNLSESWIPVSM